MGETICIDPMAEQYTKKFEQPVGKAAQPLEGSTTPPGKAVEAKLDTHDEEISSLLFQIADLSKCIKGIENKKPL